eukprot:GEMP01026309.1.p1 GENE.GEMP01026309.1~~GEMP01026309.1.p1  ORF type:complete len:286 (+),score=65.91 GEMP01026309.1:88-945(+)
MGVQSATFHDKEALSRKLRSLLRSTTDYSDLQQLLRDAKENSLDFECDMVIRKTHLLFPDAPADVTFDASLAGSPSVGTNVFVEVCEHSNAAASEATADMSVQNSGLTYRQQLTLRGQMANPLANCVPGTSLQETALPRYASGATAVTVASTVATVVTSTGPSSPSSSRSGSIVEKPEPIAGKLYHQQLFSRGQTLLERIGGLPCQIQASNPNTAPNCFTVPTAAKSTPRPVVSAAPISSIRQQTPAMAWLEQAAERLSDEELLTDMNINDDASSDEEIFFGRKI